MVTQADCGHRAARGRHPRDTLIASADAATGLVGTSVFHAATGYTLRLVGETVVSHVTRTDTPGLFVPVDVVQAGKARTGATLILRNRIVISWTVGVLRPRNQAAVIAMHEIAAVIADTQPAGIASPACPGVSVVTADASWRLLFANLFGGGRSIVPAVVRGLREPIGLSARR